MSSKLPDYLEDAYPLSGMQLGMLFHTVSHKAKGVYVEQICIDICHQDFESEVLKSSWDELVKQHAVLRTSFSWKKLKNPIQLVHKSVVTNWEELDWTQLSDVNQENRLAIFKDADRKKGIDLEVAPLFRMTLIRLSQSHVIWVWTRHHIILDGWSSSLLFSELAGLYKNVQQNLAFKSETKKRPLYRDYIAWLRKTDVTNAKEFWGGYLQGFYSKTSFEFQKPELPAAYESSDSLAGQVSVSLSKSLTQSLTALSRQHKVTLNIVVQAAWCLLLGRHTESSDILWGSTFSGRPQEISEISGLVGLCINTLPIRQKIDRNQKLPDFLAQLQKNQFEVMSYETTSLVDIQKWSNLDSVGNLFDTVVVFENYPKNTGKGSDSDLYFENIEYNEQSSLPMALVVLPESNLELISIFDPTRYTATQCTRVLQQMECLFSSMVSSPENTVGALDILPPGEIDRLKGFANIAASQSSNTGHVLSDNTSDELGFVDREFLKLSKLYPDNLAIVFGDEKLTYAELAELSSIYAASIASKLEKIAVEREYHSQNSRVVAIHVERGVTSIALMLATLQTGACYLMLDPKYPTDRLNLMLEDSKASLLIFGDNVTPLMEGQETAYTTVNNLKKQLGARDYVEPTRSLSDLAYLLYTSGSTGNPKGVKVTHRNLSASTRARTSYYEQNPSRFLLLSPLSFDSSVAGIYWTLSTGNCLVVSEPRSEQDMIGLAETISRNQITHTLCLPSLYRLLLETVSDLGRKELLSSLETVIVAGEPLIAKGIIDQHRNLAPTARLVNEYGPTETTVWCSAYDATNHSLKQIVPIGKPIENTGLFVLDKNQNLSPFGAQGELVIGGENVSAGYWRDDHSTAEKFRKCSIFNEKAEVLYFSGDLVRWLENGNLEFMGRKDRQVKIRGNRVELAEIERCIRGDKSIKDVVVTTYEPIEAEKNAAAKQLVAFLISSSEQKNTHDLRSRIEKNLSDFMMPAHFEFIEEFPKLANGKLDHDELNRIMQSRIPTDATPIVSVAVPNSEEEKVLLKAWLEVLNQNNIGLTDNFFQVGGDSISSIRVIARVRSYGYILNPHDLFEAPTIEICAKRMQRDLSFDELYVPELSNAEQQELESRYGENVEYQYELTDSQRGFLFAHLNQEILDPGHMQIQARLFGAIDHDRFLRALALVVRENEALRTSVMWRDRADPEQVVRKVIEPNCQFIETPRASALDFVKQYLDGDREERLDLEESQPWRITVISISKKDHVLCWSCHHSLVDGWSSATILKDLMAKYRNPDSVKSHYLRSNQFINYCFWLRRVDYSELEKEWRGLAADFKLSLQKSASPVSKGGNQYARSMLSLESAKVEKVTDSLRVSGLTLSQLIHAGWSSVLGAVSASQKFGFYSTVSGRNISFSGAQSVVGQLMNHLPVVVRKERASKLSSYIEQVKRMSSLLSRSEHISPVQFQSWCGSNIHTALKGRRKSTLQSLVMVENFPWEDNAQIEGESLKMVSFQRRGENDLFYEGASTNHFPLTFVVIQSNNSLQLQLDYDAQLFDAGAASALLQEIEKLLVSWSENLTGDLTKNFCRAVEKFFQSKPWSEDIEEFAESRSARKPLVGIEQSLMIIWRKVFGRQLNNVKESFFDLGGNSMMAVQLTELVRSELGLRMPLSVLFEHNTVEKLAIQLQGQISKSFQTLVKIQPQGSGRPIFGIHAEGNVLFYRSLAAALGSNYPFYGLQSPELSGTKNMFKSIPEMARDYIKEIKTVQPEGPYTIVGMCFGGWVAFEMASQLVSNGEKMQSLVILDSEGPSLQRPKSAPTIGSLANHGVGSNSNSNSNSTVNVSNSSLAAIKSPNTQASELGVWSRIRNWWETTTEYSREAPLWVKVIQHRKTGRLRELAIKYIATAPILYPFMQRFMKPESDETTQQLFEKIKLNQQFLMRQYSPKTYPRGLVFIRSEQYEARTDKQHHIPRWRRACDGEVEDYLISGQHSNLMEPPQVGKVAEIISQAHAEETV